MRGFSDLVARIACNVQTLCESDLHMSKRYLPTDDLMFRKIFGSTEHSELTAGLITDLLGFEVSEVEILNPYDIDWYRKNYEADELGETIVDVLVKLVDGTSIVVECQLAKQSFFLKRVLFYAASRYIKDYDAIRGFNKRAE